MGRKCWPYIFDDPFLRADCITILKLVLCIVDFRDGTFVLYLVDSPCDVGLGPAHGSDRKGEKGQ
jgi:hypothetical protein